MGETARNEEMGVDPKINIETAIVTGVIIAIPFIVAGFVLIFSSHP